MRKHHNYLCHVCGAKQTMAWYRSNPKKYKQSYKRNNEMAKIETLWKIAHARDYLSLVCENCGCTDIRLLTVNHLIPTLKRDYNTYGRNLWVRVRQSDDKTIKENYNILCFMCNWLHYYEWKWKDLKGKMVIQWKKT